MATSRASKRTPKILVVDDDPGLLRLLTIRLRSQKYEVEPAENAAKALSVIARFRPDLVITDLRMAEMDGIALLRELQRRWPGLNVIMLTAHGTIPDAVKATQSGAFAFLSGYFVLRLHTARWARRWLVGVLVVGVLFGTAQLVRGAHYPSHTLWTAWCCWAICLCGHGFWQGVGRVLPR